MEIGAFKLSFSLLSFNTNYSYVAIIRTTALHANCRRYIPQLKDREEKLKREKHEELEMLEMRRAADELFRQNEHEKEIRRRQEADRLKNFHVDQYVRIHFLYVHLYVSKTIFTGNAWSVF